MTDHSEQPAVAFHTEHSFDYPGTTEAMQQWVLALAKQHGKSVEAVQYIFVSDEELLEMNRSHLDHDTYTDILTFPYNYDPIETDIYISYERVKDNAKQLAVNIADEQLRVMAHGLLHMCGFDDHSEEDIAAMRNAENAAIHLWHQMQG